MSSITGSVRIRRTPEDVFDYVADPARRPEWQDAVQRIDIEHRTGEGRGTRVRETRRVQGRLMTASWEVTDYERGHRYGFRGVSGPVRPIVNMTLAPYDGGTQTQVEVEIDFETSGIGRLFGAVARRSARHDVAADGEHLKQQLESAQGPAQPTG
jgi:uncharacterized protein YndB with AHSA1/START domain